MDLSLLLSSIALVCTFLTCLLRDVCYNCSSVGTSYTYYQGFAHLASGLMAGLSALCAGICIGIVGDYGVRSFAREPKLFVGMLLILIFGEALALYGLIVGLIVGTKQPAGMHSIVFFFMLVFVLSWSPSPLFAGLCEFTHL